MNNTTTLTHKQRKQQEQADRTLVKDMLTCPYCHAISHPLSLRDPQTEQEREAVYCGSCKRDVMPFMKAYIREKELADAEVEKEIAEGKWDKGEMTAKGPLVSHIEEEDFLNKASKPKRKSSPRKKKEINSTDA